MNTFHLLDNQQEVSRSPNTFHFSKRAQLWMYYEIKINLNLIKKGFAFVFLFMEFSVSKGLISLEIERPEVSFWLKMACKLSMTLRWTNKKF
jgi:hypothetical protein